MNFTTLEGLIIKKVAVKDNDLLVSVLLRSGEKVSLYCHGGQSGRKGKASLLEIGMMNRYEVSAKRKDASVLRVKEIQSIWQHQTIRYNFKIFAGLCFVVEISELIAVSYFSDGSEKDETAKLFNIISNTLFYLDHAEDNPLFSILTLFLIKLMQEQGVFPSLDRCVLTGEQIRAESIVSLHPAEGGFCMHDALSVAGEKNIRENDIALCSLLRKSQYLSFKDIAQMDEQSFTVFYKVLSFFCYQLHQDINRFKSLNLLTK